MWRDFIKFIQRGNVIDLAVAVIIGGAFGAIVTSLVNDIIMPLIGIITGGINFAGLAAQVGQATVAYGKFIQAVVNFLIVAFVIFLVMRAYEKMRRKQEAKPPEQKKDELPQDIVLLTEIRDLLKNQTGAVRAPVASAPAPNNPPKQ